MIMLRIILRFSAAGAPIRFASISTGKDSNRPIKSPITGIMPRIGSTPKRMPVNGILNWESVIREYLSSRASA